MALANIGQIVEDIQAAGSREEGIDILRKYRGNAPFRIFLNYMFNPAISFFAFGDDLPKVNASGLPYSRGISLYSQMRRFSFFILEPNRNYPLDRMQKMFIQIVENLPGIEADLVKAILTGTAIDGLTLDMVMEAYPEDKRFRAVVTATEAFAPETKDPVGTPESTDTGTAEKEAGSVVAEITKAKEEVKPAAPAASASTVTTAPKKRGRGRPRKNPIQPTKTEDKADGPA